MCVCYGALVMDLLLHERTDTEVTINLSELGS